MRDWIAALDGLDEVGKGAAETGAVRLTVVYFPSAKDGLAYGATHPPRNHSTSAWQVVDPFNIIATFENEEYADPMTDSHEASR